jgi:hypothetical protein
MFPVQERSADRGGPSRNWGRELAAEKLREDAARGTFRENSW